MRKLNDAFTSFEFPTRDMENWKYTSMQKLLDAEFNIDVNAEVMASSSYKNNPFLQKASVHPFAHLAISAANATKVINIKESSSAPIHLKFANKKNTATIIHQHIYVAENIQAEVIFDYSSEDDSTCFATIFTEINLEKNAKLSLYKKQTLNNTSFLIDFILVEQDESSSFYSFTLDKGAALSRTDFSVNLNGQYAEANLYGVYLTSQQQVADHHSVIYHHVPHCHSRENYRGILNDQSRAIFNGKIVIEQDAQKSVTQQLNKNIVLSNQSEVDTKPELEIYADDVKASHGATVGQLDQDALFYLQARGISLEAARALLMQGFLQEVFLSIENKAVREDFLNI